MHWYCLAYSTTPIATRLAMYPKECGIPLAGSIVGFHCNNIIKTIQQIRSRIKEEKEDEYSNSVAKIQVCAMFRTGDFRRNVFLKFIRLSMETPCLYPSKGHKYGGRKLTKTYVKWRFDDRTYLHLISNTALHITFLSKTYFIDFSIKSLLSSSEGP